MDYLFEDISGGFGRFKKIGSVLAALAEDHLELALLELREEKLNLISVLLFLGLGVCFVLAALISITALVVFFLPPADRLTGLALLSGFYLLAAGLFLWRAIRKLGRMPKPFSATIDEIRKDLKCF